MSTHSNTRLKRFPVTKCWFFYTKKERYWVNIDFLFKKEMESIAEGFCMSYVGFFFHFLANVCMFTIID